MRRTTLRRTADAGFTLIELLIVIIILGILAAIVVFSVTGITNKGDKAACQASVATIDTAYEAYIANGGTGTTATVTVSSLAPKYLHNAPANVGSLTIVASTPPAAGDTKVLAVDQVAC